MRDKIASLRRMRSWFPHLRWASNISCSPANRIECNRCSIGDAGENPDAGPAECHQFIRKPVGRQESQEPMVVGFHPVWRETVNRATIQEISDAMETA